MGTTLTPPNVPRMEPTGQQTAAPAAALHIEHATTSRTRVRALRVAATSWPHVELRASVGDHTKIRLDLSPAEASALAWGLLQAADGLE
jgi:DNA-binding transcriptional regulator YdaS (Cro superfamily)